MAGTASFSKALPLSGVLPRASKAVYIATDGNLQVWMSGNTTSTVTFTAVKAGQIYDISVANVVSAPANSLALY